MVFPTKVRSLIKQKKKTRSISMVLFCLVKLENGWNLSCFS